MVAPRPSSPVVLGEARGIDFHLGGHIVDHHLGDLGGMFRKAPFELEVLEHDAEPEPSRARLVADQAPVALHERPAVDEVFWAPARSHQSRPSRSGPSIWGPSQVQTVGPLAPARLGNPAATLPLAVASGASGLGGLAVLLSILHKRGKKGGFRSQTDGPSRPPLSLK